MIKTDIPKRPTHCVHAVRKNRDKSHWTRTAKAST